MTCHRFDRQVSDWLSRRLSPEQSEEMAAHEQKCTRCRRLVQAETDLQRCFREVIPPALPDLWPRLALRLEAEAPKKTGLLRPTLLLPQRWAVASAVALVALTACWSHLPGDQTGAGRGRTMEAKKTLPTPAMTASSTGPLAPSQAPAWSQIGNAAQDDPAIDDPIGTNMEDTWTCLNTDK